MSEAVRAEASALVASSLSGSDRVLVTGAGGWFGSTVAALLRGTGVPAMYVTQNPRPVPDGTGTVDAVAWDRETVRAFGPTVVVDCAFVLRDHIGTMPLERYVHVNTVLTSRLLQVAQLPGVRAVISVSSGAAVHPHDASLTEVDADPYGYLKRQCELALLALGDQIDANVVVARPWSLSGTLVTRPHRYAFSDLIQQARRGAINIQAGHDVWRRYVGVDDFFAVAFASTAERRTVLDSGGELVEFGALAERIVGTLGADATISRASRTTAPPDDYYTRGSSWTDACAAYGFEPADLDRQIVAVDEHLHRAAQPSN